MKFWAGWWLRLVAENQRDSFAQIYRSGKDAGRELLTFLVGLLWLLVASWWALPACWLIRRHRDRGRFRSALTNIRADKLRCDWNIRDRLNVFPHDRRYQILIRAIEHRKRMRKRAALKSLQGLEDGNHSH